MAVICSRIEFPFFCCSFCLFLLLWLPFFRSFGFWFFVFACTSFFASRGLALFYDVQFSAPLCCLYFPSFYCACRGASVVIFILYFVVFSSVLLAFPPFVYLPFGLLPVSFTSSVFSCPLYFALVLGCRCFLCGHGCSLVPSFLSCSFSLGSLGSSSAPLPLTSRASLLFPSPRCFVRRAFSPTHRQEEATQDAS